MSHLDVIQSPLAYSVADTAKILGVSEQTVRKLINQGDLKALRAAKRVLIPKHELERFFREQPMKRATREQRVAGASDADGAALPGVTFGPTNGESFVRFLGGELSSFQRIYDSTCLPGDRDKEFYGSTKGAFVVLQPKGETLPKSGAGLSRMLEQGYEVVICEGFATGASITLARPTKAAVFCALYAGNLANVAAALRRTYGYTRTLEIGPREKKRKALDLCIWADFDESKTGQQKAHTAALEYNCCVRVPRFGSGFGDFNDLHAAGGQGAVKRSRPVTSDAMLAFAKKLGKQKLSLRKHLAPFALPDSGAALIIRASQENSTARQLSVSRSLVNALIASGKLPHRKSGQKVLISHEALVKFFKGKK